MAEPTAIEKEATTKQSVYAAKRQVYRQLWAQADTEDFRARKELPPLVIKEIK